MKRMKRAGVALLIAAALFFLTACADSIPSGSYTVARENGTFTVDPEAGTISDGEHVYRFTVSGNSVTITYPDGSAYWWTTQQSDSSGISAGYGGWSDDYAPGRYVDGDTLIDLLETRTSSDSPSSHPFFGILLLLLGLWSLISPRTSWYLSHGWRYKNAEPSDAALAVARIGGGCAVLFGIILVLV